jgi:hypothetical protein
MTNNVKRKHWPFRVCPLPPENVPPMKAKARAGDAGASADVQRVHSEPASCSRLADDPQRPVSHRTR